MTQAIDRLPPPKEQRKLKLIVLSCSRTGTLGLYHALKALGYTPYHMQEVCTVGGPEHMKIFEEAIIAYNNRFSGLRRLGKADFDKWMGAYDCILEIPSYLGTDVPEAYLSDPDVKFILTERDPSRWVESLDNTGGFAVAMSRSFPHSVLQHFHRAMRGFFSLNKALHYSYSDGTDRDDPAHRAILERNYTDYISLVKAKIPADRMLVLKLERDGLGWEQICPFLGREVPDMPWPQQNTAEQFQQMVSGLIGSMTAQAALNCAAVVVPVVGVAAWAGIKYGQTVLDMVRR